VEAARKDHGVIRAAGGIVVRGDDVLLVHRPKYDDWSLPKGKCKKRESDEECALREVQEETGLHCEIVRPLGESRYRVLARPKVVRWFLMRPRGGEFTPHNEVDEIAWVPRANVPDVLTFDAGVEVLAQL
jgi:8-oxo-dGTP pyrophosphatase MutT (NUDIX family)